MIAYLTWILIFAFFILALAVTEYQSRRDKKRKAEVSQSTLNIAQIADRRYEKVYGERSPTLIKAIPELQNKTADSK